MIRKKRLNEYLTPYMGQMTPKLIKIKDGYIREGRHIEYGFVKEVHVTTQRPSLSKIYGFVYRDRFIKHREDGPAVENDFNNTCEFYFNGFRIIDTQQYCFLCGMDEIETLMMVLKYGSKG